MKINENLHFHCLIMKHYQRVKHGVLTRLVKRGERLVKHGERVSNDFV